MAELNLYDVDFGDFPTQIKLSDEDAKAYGDRASKVGSIERDLTQAKPRRAERGKRGFAAERSSPLRRACHAGSERVTEWVRRGRRRARRTGRSSRDG